MHKITNIIITFLIATVAIASLLAVIDHPGLWPVAVVTLYLFSLELKAYYIDLGLLFRKIKKSH